MFLLSLTCKRSGKEHFESKNVQILVMKCASEMQFMEKFCYLTVKSVPFCCKILLGDVRRIIVAFTDVKSHETGFLAFILNAAWSQRAKICHYLNPFEIARAIQLCQCD